METVRIYRIENNNGIGPYCGTAETQWVTCWKRHNDKPTPDKDGIPDEAYAGRGSARCAFTSIAKLKEWFDCQTELHNLSKIGFEVAVYEVPTHAVWHGNRQSVFDADQAKRIAKMKLLPKACEVLK